MFLFYFYTYQIKFLYNLVLLLTQKKIFLEKVKMFSVIYRAQLLRTLRITDKENKKLQIYNYFLDPPVDSSSSSRISLLQNVHKENVNASTGQSTFDATIFNKNADDDSIETLDDVNSIETHGNDTVVDSKKLEEVLKVDKSSGQNLETPESNLPGTVDENLSENSSSTSDGNLRHSLKV